VNEALAEELYEEQSRPKLAFGKKEKKKPG
jgi:hypothetical protein